MAASTHQEAGPPGPRFDLVLVCPHLGPGGVQRVITLLANAWSQSGYKICVITLYDHETAYELAPAVRRLDVADDPLLRCVEPLRRAFGRGLGCATPLLLGLLKLAGLTGAGDPWSQLQRLTGATFPYLYLPLQLRARVLRRAIKKSGSPVVISFCGSTNVISVVASAGVSCRLLISERNDPARQKLEGPWEILRRLYYNQAEVVTANTHGALRAMRGYVDPHKMVFVPNPVVLPETPSDHTTSTLSLLIVGRLHPQKAHDVMFEAFALLGARYTDWELHVVGSGALEGALRQLARKLGIARRVVWHGQVRDPFPHYERATIFVLPSRHEGTPNALLEAMGCGMPCIVSDASSGPLELVQDGETGIVVKVDDPAALAGAIQRLAADPALRSRLGTAARAAVEAYSLPRALAAWETLIGWQT